MPSITPSVIFLPPASRRPHIFYAIDAYIAGRQRRGRQVCGSNTLMSLPLAITALLHALFVATEIDCHAHQMILPPPHAHMPVAVF